MQPVIVFSRIFGLCPIRYKNCGQYFSLEWSQWYAIYSLIILVVMSALTLFSMVLEIELTLETDKKRKYLSTCDILTITLIAVFCVLATPGKLKSFWKICHYLNKSDEYLVFLNPTRYRRNSIFFIISVLFIYSSIYIFDILAWHTNYQQIDGAFTLFRDYIPFYILKYIMLNEILFFCHMIYFIRIRLACLSNSLQAIIRQRIFEVSSLQNGEIRVLPPNLTYDPKINDIAIRVQEFTKVHKNLFEAVEIINGTVEFGIIIIIFCIMLHLVVSPYFLFTEIGKGYRKNDIFILLQFMWVLAHAGKFGIILETSHYCVSEAQNLHSIVQNLFTQETVGKTKKALLFLIMQLTSCKIQLNVIGLFRLDRSILSAFVASITTYLVVLLQFK